MPSALFDRLFPIFDESFAADTRAGDAHWAAGFGDPIANVHTVVVHLTAGWPGRNKANGFVRRFITEFVGDNADGAVVPCSSCNGAPAGSDACDCKWGIGPQYYISSDGTVARVVGDVRDQELLAFHGNHTNDWAIGIETGNLYRTAHPPGGSWRRVSHDDAHEDIPGANLWVRDHRDNPREVLGCWWTTANWRFPLREPIAGAANRVRMLFSEWQYRAHALLGRFLAEQFLVPRNLPLFPWAARGDNVNDVSVFRQIVLADPAFDTLVAAFDAGWNLGAAQFLPANLADLQDDYDDRVSGLSNRAWTRMIETFRGFHGHAFSGSNRGRDHDCPGPLFDWHRYARELYDYWWYPFDLTIVAPTIDTFVSNGPQRPYRRADGTVPLVEYYFDVVEPMVPNSDPANRIVEGLHGVAASPSTFELEEHSPIYALANGELVAARFVAAPIFASPTVSLSFLLVRHEVFHEAAPAAAAGAPVLAAGRIDYDRAPSTVYSLYMHLGAPAGMDLTAVSDDNPDWLNRVLVRHRECTLGVTYFDGDAVAGIDPQDDIAAAAWNSVPPGVPARDTLLEGWRHDKDAYGTFLTQLRAGDIALAPTSGMAMPMRVLLGDFLGESGPIRTDQTFAGTPTFGIRVEAFSPTFRPAAFVPALSWSLPSAGGSNYVQAESDWARVLDPTDIDLLTERGVEDVSLATWWSTVEAAVTADPRLAADARLPANGQVFQFKPIELMQWLNALTWQSEWAKFQVMDAAGNPVAAPARPRSRRL